MADTFTIATQSFEGPLEALLDLIESRKLSVSQVSLSEVCDSYLAHIEKLPQLPLAQTSQFILVASTLLLIKSRTLLPNLELSADERESVEELERRLSYLRAIRKAARLLRATWGKAPLVLLDGAPSKPAVFAPAEATSASLLASAKRILATLPKPSELAQAVVVPVVALEDVIKQVHARLSHAIRARFSELTRSADRSGTIVHFLAILELVRSGSASVTQEKLFSDIEIELEGISAPRYG